MAVFVLLCILPAASADEILPLTNGFYRLEGVCKSMTFAGDQTANCGNFAGINATDPTQPIFIFPRRDGGAWMFSTSNGKAANDGSGALTFRISTLLDLAAKANFKYDDGECVLDPHVPGPNITCTIWSDSSKTHIAWQAVFVGNGIWKFSRAK